MRSLLAIIQAESEMLHTFVKFNTDEQLESSIELDRQLGVIEALVYTARQTISDEWRALRDSRPKRTASTPHTIDSLL